MAKLVNTVRAGAHSTPKHGTPSTVPAWTGHSWSPHGILHSPDLLSLQTSHISHSESAANIIILQVTQQGEETSPGRGAAANTSPIQSHTGPGTAKTLPIFSQLLGNYN